MVPLVSYNCWHCKGFTWFKLWFDILSISSFCNLWPKDFLSIIGSVLNKYEIIMLISCEVKMFKSLLLVYQLGSQICIFVKQSFKYKCQFYEQLTLVIS